MPRTERITPRERELMLDAFWRGVAAHARHIGDAEWRQRADDLRDEYDESLGPTTSTST